MEIRTELDEEFIHKNYEEYEKKQFVVAIDSGETVVIQIKNDQGAVIKEKIYTPKYSDTNFSFTWFSKGEKSDEPIYEYKLVRKE